MEAPLDGKYDFVRPLKQGEDASGLRLVEQGLVVDNSRRGPVQSRLGKGAFGATYRVSSRGDDALYAVKVIELEDIADEAQLSNVKKEAKALRELRHENIVNYSTAFFAEDNTLYCILMELCMRPIVSMQSPSPESPSSVLEWMHQLASALAYLHDVRGIAHRDLKGDNVLLRYNDTVAVADVGLAVAFGAQGASYMSVKGAMAYKPPEQLGAAGADHGKAEDVQVEVQVDNRLTPRC